MKQKADLNFILALIVLMINNKRLIFLPFTLLAASYILIYSSNSNKSQLRNLAILTIFTKVFRTAYVYGITYQQTPIIFQVIIDILPALASLFLLFKGLETLNERLEIKENDTISNAFKINFASYLLNLFITLSMHLLITYNPYNILNHIYWLFQKPIYMIIELAFLAITFTLTKGLRDLYTEIMVDGV